MLLRSAPENFVIWLVSSGDQQCGRDFSQCLGDASPVLGLGVRPREAVPTDRKIATVTAPTTQVKPDPASKHSPHTQRRQPRATSSSSTVGDNLRCSPPTWHRLPT
jgi:hypothetical protein